MTRFLPRVLDDPQCGGFNEETKRLFAYHQATKHSYQSIRTNAHFLDWKNQPDPFRTYEGAPKIMLPPEPGFPNTGAFTAMAALAGRTRMASGNKSEDREQIQLDGIWLSRLLWHSMAISAWKKVPRTGDRYSLRVNPSSGNLHPTETYLALRGFTGLDDGLYHYRADGHALELRRPGAWTQQLARALMIPWAAESPLIVGLTSIFWREAWKYRDRAYRYCCHDLGHAMMSLLLAACALGLPGGAITHFGDFRLTRALGLTGGDEAPMAFLVFPSKSSSGRLPAPPEEALAGIPNELSTEEVPYELLLEIHRSTILPDPVGPPPRIPPAHAAIADDQASLPESLREPARDARLGATVRRRRSALDFDARTPPMERNEVEQLLDFATRDWPADWRGNFGGVTTPVERGADFVTLYLYVHRLRDCEPGVYRWDRTSRSLEQLHRGNVERVAAYLSLEQALAGNACFAVSMIADLAEAARVFGNRGYRYVHFEAGAIGQRLYVGAEVLGWNATGIGAFYDDDVHRYLGFLEEGETPVGVSLHAAEQAALVMLGSPTSRRAAAQDRDRCESAPVISESGEEHLSGLRQFWEKEEEPAPRRDPRTLPRQVIYHFAVGRAIPDPRLEA
ncbi:MAG: SagB/ThcOx family dehydrogenase [Acidobacteria bacterium]|nr:SagB/ThcOx family dehydrogenase [Acidobacteriota bacterium]